MSGSDEETRENGYESDDDSDGDAGALEPARLEELVEAFVAMHAGMSQHGAEWYAGMASTVGGSEVAAVMGMSSYGKFEDVVRKKVQQRLGQDPWGDGFEACHWGSLYEDVVGAFVSADLGCRIHGDTICIRGAPGQRYSPDGYAVVRFYRGDDGELRLWTTDMGPEVPTTSRIVLLEFKCPISRKLDGRVPKQYTPQVWAGLAASPIAHFGLYAEAVFRKCALADLGDSPAYDRVYHARDGEDTWAGPLAWGLIYVYAPRTDAPRHVRYGWRGPEWAEGDPTAEARDADASLAANAIRAQCAVARGAAARGASRAAALVDFGAAEPRLFARALGLIDRGRFPVVRGPPCFADGRTGETCGAASVDTGGDTGVDAGVDTGVSAARAAAPAGHALLGVLPWKLFAIDYHPVGRRPGFAAEVRPLIDEVHRLVAEACAAPDPLAWLAARRRAAIPAVHGRADGVSADEMQALFDASASD